MLQEFKVIWFYQQWIFVYNIYTTVIWYNIASTQLQKISYTLIALQFGNIYLLMSSKLIIHMSSPSLQNPSHKQLYFDVSLAVHYPYTNLVLNSCILFLPLHSPLLSSFSISMVVYFKNNIPKWHCDISSVTTTKWHFQTTGWHTALTKPIEAVYF